MLPFTACVSLRDCFANNELLHSPFAAYLIIVRIWTNQSAFIPKLWGFASPIVLATIGATVSAGEGLTIGIHPTSTKYPAPGTKGAMMLGLDLHVPVDKAIARLARHGVQIKGNVVRSEPGNFAHLKILTAMRFTCWKASQAVSEAALVGSSAT